MQTTFKKIMYYNSEIWLIDSLNHNYYELDSWLHVSLLIYNYEKDNENVNKDCKTGAQWHIGMSSASHREDPVSNSGKGRFFRIK